jgi:growth hormone-inducible transmembrane protein
MAFVLRRPFTLTSSPLSLATKQAPRTLSISISLRNFHAKPPLSAFFTPKPSPRPPTLSKHVLLQPFRRTYTPENPAIQRPAAGNVTQRLLYGAGIFGGTLVAINLLFNRETREDGGMPAYERSYLNETFLTSGLGLGIIGIAAKTLHQNGWSYRLMATNPWLVIGVSLAASIGSMYGTFATSPDK